MALEKVLIIDDEPLILKTTALLMKKSSNAEIITAQNGPDGIALARKEKPDLILLDIIMPDMNGWEVLKVLKIDEVCSRIPVIVFTATDYSISDSMAKENGAAVICRKPFQLHQLMNVVQKVENEVDNG
jgi:twitching motility two-component system response regulator PilH